MPGEVSSDKSHIFLGLQICVTGLTKEERKFVKERTEALGGEYDCNLTPKCTHLIVQILFGAKLQHSVKHAIKYGRHIVKIQWFLDSVRLQVRQIEQEYSIGDSTCQLDNVWNRRICSGLGAGETTELCGELEKDCHNMETVVAEFGDVKKITEVVGQMFQENICHQEHKAVVSHEETILGGGSFFIDPNLPLGVKEQVCKALDTAGSSHMEEFYSGGDVSHVVCDLQFLHKYVARNLTIVTPMWVMRSVERQKVQRVVQLSADMGSQLSSWLTCKDREPVIQDKSKIDNTSGPETVSAFFASREETTGNGVSEQLLKRWEENMRTAKEDVRLRRQQALLDMAENSLSGSPGPESSRNVPCQPTPPSLLDSLSWTITEPPAQAQIICDDGPPTVVSDTADNSWHVGNESEKNIFSAGNLGAPECNLTKTSTLEQDHGTYYTRKMTERELEEIIFKGPFLTILFPVDRFDEVGPKSKTVFSTTGFTRKSILDIVYKFYQENMTPEEIDLAMHTDSKHGDRLRNNILKWVQIGVCEGMKRSEFMGSRRSLEGLRRISRHNAGRVYELLLGS